MTRSRLLPDQWATTPEGHAICPGCGCIVHYSLIYQHADVCRPLHAQQPAEET